MPHYQLLYSGFRSASEFIDADDDEEAEDLARRRLLFHEPGFTIAVCRDGVELRRLVQRARPTRVERDPWHG